MNKTNDKTIWQGVVISLLLVYAYSARYVIPKQDILPDTVLQLSRAMIHLGVVVFWMASIKRRILQDSVRFYLLAVASLLIFWLYIRDVKWFFFYERCTPVRYFWYGFYIPIILIPLFGVFIIDYIGKPETYKMPRWMNLFYIPAIILIGFVFTNDLHRLVFDFPKGLEYSSSIYTYKILYFLVILWPISLGFYFVIMLLLKCRAPGSKWFQKSPLLVISLATVFWTLYYLKMIDHDLTSVSCFTIILLLESAIQSGAIRSNSQYEDLFQSSSIEAQIVDEDYRLCYASETAKSLDERIMRQAVYGPINLGNKRLGSGNILHGHVLWCDDVTEINQFTAELEKTGLQLAESNDLMKAELELQEKNLRMTEKNRLYDRIANEVGKQLDKLELLLNDEESTYGIREKLIDICFISAYIKRRSNLLLISENNDFIPGKELEFCLRESMDNIRLTGSMCSMDSVCEGKIGAKYVVAVYDLFQNILEQALWKFDALLIKVLISNGNLFLRIQMDYKAAEVLCDKTEWTSLGGSLSIRKSDDTFWIELQLQGGGWK